ncbi:MAG: hypothetical protein JWO38_3460 [Gemmataceae bacterium]|nr:hypothetical protein [Gemmataceae bacterium]
MIRLSRLGLGAFSAVVLAGAPTARAADPDKLLPADAEFAFSFNVNQVLESEIVKKYALEQIKQALQGNDAQKFMKELGLDPLKDIEKVVIGGSGKDQTDVKFLVIVHGKFDPDKLYKAAEAQTKKDGDHFSLVKDGKDVMFKYQPDTGNPMYGTVVDESTVVLGVDKKSISTALATAGESKKPAVSKDLSALITKMDDKASVWVAWVAKGKLDNLKIPPGAGGPNLPAQLAKLDTVSAVVRVTADVTAEITFGMKDADAADEMGKTIEDGLMQIKGLLPFLTAQNPQMKPLAEAAKTLKSTVKDKGVVVSAKLTGSAIGQMLNPKGGD